MELLFCNKHEQKEGFLTYGYHLCIGQCNTSVPYLSANSIEDVVRTTSDLHSFKQICCLYRYTFLSEYRYTRVVVLYIRCCLSYINGDVHISGRDQEQRSEWHASTKNETASRRRNIFGQTGSGWSCKEMNKLLKGYRCNKTCNEIVYSTLF